MKLSKKEIETTILKLIKNQYWLDSRASYVALERLFEECANREELALITELINLFLHTNADDFYDFYKGEAKRIAEDASFVSHNCIIGPTKDGIRPDSSRAITRPFANYLSRTGKNLTVCSNFEYIAQFISNTNQKKIIVVLLDDFIGTGQTMICKMTECNELVEKNKAIEECNYQIISLAAMEHGKEEIENTGASVYSRHILKRGISDHYHGLALRRARNNMKRLESLFFNNPVSHEYSFGYRQSEALYVKIDYETIDSSNGGNIFELDRTPNNVFPLFWWPEYLNNLERSTLLFRFR